MPNITFILPDESIKVVDAFEGDSIMQTAVDAGIEDITADCGGNCSWIELFWCGNNTRIGVE